MLFNEIYGAYYNTVAEILRLATVGGLDDKGLKRIVEDRAFGESIMTIPPALKSGRWQIMNPDLTTAIKNPPQMPLTLMQKRWLKAISLDRRVGLFGFDFSFLGDVEPLFDPQSIHYYDRYADGDDFEDTGYVERFRLILSAVKQRHPLKIEYESGKGNRMQENVIPEYLEYSEKDDKFRLITSGCKYVRIINVARIISCKLYFGDKLNSSVVYNEVTKNVTFELTDKRNTLERAMIHFSNFEKTIVKSGEGLYTVNIFYDESDETELLIRILSFGPTVKVVAPESFTELVKERLIKQKNCGLR